LVDVCTLQAAGDDLGGYPDVTAVLVVYSSSFLASAQFAQSFVTPFV